MSKKERSSRIRTIDEAIQDYIDTAHIPSPGHLDESGKLKPESERAELRNKLQGVVEALGQNRPDLAHRLADRLREVHSDPSLVELIDKVLQGKKI